MDVNVPSWPDVRYAGYAPSSMQHTAAAATLSAAVSAACSTKRNHYLSIWQDQLLDCLPPTTALWKFAAARAFAAWFAATRAFAAWFV